MIGLVLEGGGARGSYHVGAIRALLKHGIKFDAAVGTSIGSINAAFVASNDFKKLYKLWKSVSSKEMFDIEEDIIIALKNRKITSDIVKRGLKTTSKIIKNRGIEIEFIRKLLNDNLNEKKLKRSKIEYGLATYNLSDRKTVQVFKKDIPKGKLVDYIIASCYLPVFKFEKIIDEKYYLDGGVWDNCPVDMLIDKGYKTIYVVRSWRNKLSYKSTKDTKVVVIQARKTLGSVLLFEKENNIKNMKLGYFDTLKKLENLDGIDYYFRYEEDEYYKSIINKKHYKKIKQKYGSAFSNETEKELIVKILEKICKEENLDRFKVYSIPYLIFKIKLKYQRDKSNYYYDFISSLKVRMI